MSSREIQAQESDQVSQVLNSDYYKKLQSSLKEKMRLQTVQSDKDRDGQNIEDSTKIKAVEGSLKAKDIHQRLKFQDAVQIQSMVWEKDSEGDFKLKEKPAPVFSAVDMTHSRPDKLRAVGYKIDYSDRLSTLKQSLMQNVVQSRSGNFFLSAYAKFKVGVLVQMLSVLGVAPEELGQLQKQALADAIQENIALMEENMYTSELARLVQGSSKKKSKKAMAMFQEVETQLVAQMSRLGRSDYWTELRLAEERLHQDERIYAEFKKEHRDLSYQLNYYFGKSNGT
jgi:hypothetical protein